MKVVSQKGILSGFFFNKVDKNNSISSHSMDFFFCFLALNCFLQQQNHLYWWRGKHNNYNYKKLPSLPSCHSFRAFIYLFLFLSSSQWDFAINFPVSFVLFHFSYIFFFFFFCQMDAISLLDDYFTPPILLPLLLIYPHRNDFLYSLQSWWNGVVCECCVRG